MYLTTSNHPLTTNNQIIIKDYSRFRGELWVDFRRGITGFCTFHSYNTHFASLWRVVRTFPHHTMQYLCNSYRQFVLNFKICVWRRGILEKTCMGISPCKANDLWRHTVMPMERKRGQRISQQTPKSRWKGKSQNKLLVFLSAENTHEIDIIQ